MSDLAIEAVTVDEIVRGIFSAAAWPAEQLDTLCDVLYGKTGRHCASGSAKEAAMGRRVSSIIVALVLVLSGWLTQAPGTRAASACFPETGHCIQGRFLDYWEQHGGLAINGFPLSDERQELLEDGQTYTVQYFERVRMEYHPENQPPYDVLLGQFGRRELYLPGARPSRGPQPPVDAKPSYTWFPQTGHNVAADFLSYWEQNGGLAQFGYPLTEEFIEGFGPQTYTVHYFERARFERHPENQPPYDILLGQFGRDILAQVNQLSGPLGVLYTTNTAVQQQLGRPTMPAAQVPGAAQDFEHGRMLWRGDLRHIYVLCGGPATGPVLVSGQYNPQGGSQQTPFFVDTWQEGQDPGGGPAPMLGLFYPRRGFGKVWRENPPVQQCLGYATHDQDIGYTMTAQEFELGVALSDPDGRGVYIITTEFFQAGGLAATYSRYDIPIR
ncbi:MAG: hypothetical protein ACTHMJ_08925 [Thermomicrobiales bacterium]